MGLLILFLYIYLSIFRLPFLLLFSRLGLPALSSFVARRRPFLYARRVQMAAASARVAEGRAAASLRLVSVPRAPWTMNKVA